MAGPREIIIGTRPSRLAIIQAEEIKEALEKRFPKIRIRLKKVAAAGDIEKSRSIEEFKERAIFTKTIDLELLNRRIDLALHSLKDLPLELEDGLEIAAITKRLDPRDALVSKKRFSLVSLPKGFKIGTSSPRRTEYLKFLRPDLEVVNLRGNLDTRLLKLIRREVDALIVACSGMLRLISDQVSGRPGLKLLKLLKEVKVSPIPLGKILPAAGQGALAIIIRKDDEAMKKILHPLNDKRSAIEASAEREVLKNFGGGCKIPIGVFGKIIKNNLILKAALLDEKLRWVKERSVRGDREDYLSLAKRLYEKFKTEAA